MFSFLVHRACRVTLSFRRDLLFRSHMHAPFRLRTYHGREGNRCVGSLRQGSGDRFNARQAWRSRALEYISSICERLVLTSRPQPVYDRFRQVEEGEPVRLKRKGRAYVRQIVPEVKSSASMTAEASREPHVLHDPRLHCGSGYPGRRCRK